MFLTVVAAELGRRSGWWRATPGIATMRHAATVAIVPSVHGLTAPAGAEESRCTDKTPAVPRHANPPNHRTPSPYLTI